MNHLEESKQKLINRIRGMSVDEYDKLTGMLYDEPQKYYELFGSGIMFVCEDCEGTYGKCHDDADECTARFREYMSGDAEESE